jgi:nucleoside 2-deoxyribosyltransferase
MRVYIAGPMTGLPDFNYPAFNAEADRLRELGYHVENPAENPEQPTWAAYMRQAIRQMLTCDAVALLPNWKQSRGALIEHGIAIALGMPARPCEEFQGELDVMTRSNYAMRTQGELPHA